MSKPLSNANWIIARHASEGVAGPQNSLDRFVSQIDALEAWMNFIETARADQLIQISVPNSPADCLAKFKPSGEPSYQSHSCVTIADGSDVVMLNHQRVGENSKHTFTVGTGNRLQAKPVGCDGGNRFHRGGPIRRAVHFEDGCKRSNPSKAFGDFNGYSDCLSEHPSWAA